MGVTETHLCVRGYSSSLAWFWLTFPWTLIQRKNKSPHKSVRNIYQQMDIPSPLISMQRINDSPQKFIFPQRPVDSNRKSYSSALCDEIPSYRNPKCRRKSQLSIEKKQHDNNLDEKQIDSSPYVCCGSFSHRLTDSLQQKRAQISLSREM